MGSADRLIRILVAVVFAVLYFAGIVPGVLGLTLVVLGGIFLLTSFVSFCPIYAIFGMSTCAVEPKE